MNITTCISVLLFLISTTSWSQVVIDSTQSHDIRYWYEIAFSLDELDSIKTKWLSTARRKWDSLRVSERISSLPQKLTEDLPLDTTESCEILFVGDSIDFKFIIDGEEVEYVKSDFSEVRIPNDYPDFENQCKIRTYKKANRKVKARFISEELSYSCTLDLSYSKIKIENAINISLVEISTMPDPNGGLPIPIQTIVIDKGAIEISHKW